MNKICTSFEQSKKLIELGIDPDTADMGYLWWMDTETKKEGIDEIPTVLNGLPLEKCDIPAWSLTALINLMPESIMRKDKIHDEMTYVPSFERTISPSCVYYRNYSLDAMDRAFASYGEDDKDLVDACCNMIGWLIKNGYIKMEKK